GELPQARGGRKAPLRRDQRDPARAKVSAISDTNRCRLVSTRARGAPSGLSTTPGGATSISRLSGLWRNTAVSQDARDRVIGVSQAELVSGAGQGAGPVSGRRIAPAQTVAY
ncbi:hypothetical protein, partial [Pararhodobacter sp.]